MYSINISMGHTAVIAAAAQHGSHHDCIYVCQVRDFGGLLLMGHILSVHRVTTPGTSHGASPQRSESRDDKRVVSVTFSL